MSARISRSRASSRGRPTTTVSASGRGSAAHVEAAGTQQPDDVPAQRAHRRRPRPRRSARGPATPGSTERSSSRGSNAADPRRLSRHTPKKSRPPRAVGLADAHVAAHPLRPPSHALDRARDEHPDRCGLRQGEHLGQPPGGGRGDPFHDRLPRRVDHRPACAARRTSARSRSARSSTRASSATKPVLERRRPPRRRARRTSCRALPARPPTCRSRSWSRAARSGRARSATRSAPYRLELQSDPSEPILAVYSQAPSAAEAQRLADSAILGLQDYLRESRATSRGSPRTSCRRCGNSARARRRHQQQGRDRDRRR